MNRIVIIGNGFDMAHGLKTSYMDFINWYWNQRVKSFVDNHTKVSADALCTMTINSKWEISSWNAFANKYIGANTASMQPQSSFVGIIQKLEQQPKDFSVEYSPLCRMILQSIETKGWVDIENDYYQLLKEGIGNSRCAYTIGELNEQLSFLQDKLIEYLQTLDAAQYRNDIGGEIKDFFKLADISTEGRDKAINNIGIDAKDFSGALHNYEIRNKLYPKQTMLLSFNYTETVKMYSDVNISYNYIHGELCKPENVVFGYGDELDKDYKDILDKNDNVLLKNVKSVKYLETRRYREMLEFLRVAPFQVYIMGHSCGNSDRTLLNTIFEHKNCVSIKPYYHKFGNGNDNYLELVQNISRNFTDMKLFRDRVVNKEQCKTI